MYFTDDALFPENMQPTIITAAPFGPEWLPGDVEELPVTFDQQVQAAIESQISSSSQLSILETNMTQRLSLTVLAAAIAGFSTLAVGAQPAPDIGNSSPIILAQQTPPAFQTEGAAGQTTPPSKTGAPKTPTLRQEERAMKAKCDAMSAGPQKDACMKDYRAYVGGVTQGTPPPAEFRTEGQAGGMGKVGGAPKTAPPSGPAVSTPPAFQTEGAAGQTTPSGKK